MQRWWTKDCDLLCSLAQTFFIFASFKSSECKVKLVCVPACMCVLLIATNHPVEQEHEK